MKGPSVWLVILLIICVVVALAAYLLSELSEALFCSRCYNTTRPWGTGQGYEVGSLPDRGVVYAA